MLNYRDGLHALKQYARGTDWSSVFETLATELLENLQRESLFGTTEQLRSDRYHIVYRLNELTDTHQLGVTFTDLCQTTLVPPISPISVKKLKQVPLSEPAPSLEDQPVPESKPGPQPADVQQPRYGTKQRWAVLVGVNTYEDASAYPSLKVCSHDVQVIRAQLLRGGFPASHILTLTDDEPERFAPKFENILSTLASVAQRTEEDDLLLFYFSGHGALKDGKSYLVPRNGRQAALRDTAVAIERVAEIMQTARAQAKVIILDACHSGVQGSAKASQPMPAHFIESFFEQATGMAIYSSCQHDQLSYLFEEKNCSVFTYYLLGALQGKADREKKGFVTVHDMNRYVTPFVQDWAAQNGLDQRPWLNYFVSGDILLADFRRPGPNAVLPEPEPPDDSGLAPGSGPASPMPDHTTPQTPFQAPANTPGLSAEDDTRLEKYVGNGGALRRGQAQRDLLEQLAQLGAKPKQNMPGGPDDLLVSYKKVPLHAVFLYTSEDQEVHTYIAENLGALDSLSDDFCDIYINKDQFENKEDGYDLLKNLRVIHNSGIPRRADLPGLFFWDHQGESEFLPFDSPLSHDTIKYTLRPLFDMLCITPTIATVTHYKQKRRHHGR